MGLSQDPLQLALKELEQKERLRSLYQAKIEESLNSSKRPKYRPYHSRFGYKSNSSFDISNSDELTSYMANPSSKYQLAFKALEFHILENKFSSPK
ncbi:hypothetical protein PVK06_039584 [Gossypium arboreum]|uniref:Uncharacterized protein n=1 Tax=Gossypium arboreum TaxID=29729 RepID=A0ABR0N5E5_GOSAR|nr:hypothetical protein PVK06_039584 [Gossypium arboreum]